ncbi:hypothetical protein FI667_g2774, partial [Globisporangium splendens]
MVVPTTNVTISSRGLHVSPLCYTRVWYSALGMCMVCRLFLTFTTGVHFFVARPDMSYYAAMLGPSASQGLNTVGYVFGGSAVAHAYELINMLWFSVRYRELVYERRASRNGFLVWIACILRCQFNNKVNPNASQDCCCLCKHRSRSRISSRSPPSKPSESRWRCFLSFLKRIWKGLFGRLGLFGVESEYFEIQFAVREVFEIISVSVQAYSCSRVSPEKVDQRAFRVGVGHQLLPVGLVDIQISISNLTTLLDDLCTKWRHPASNFYIEHLRLTEFPSALTRLQVEDLSLFGSRIESLADVRFGPEFNMLKTIVLTGNPMRELPAIRPPFTKLEVVSLENT